MFINIMLKKLLYLYNDGHNPFPNMHNCGLGYHLPNKRKRMRGRALHIYKNDDGEYEIIDDGNYADANIYSNEEGLPKNFVDKEETKEKEDVEKEAQDREEIKNKKEREYEKRNKKIESLFSEIDEVLEKNKNDEYEEDSETESSDKKEDNIYNTTNELVSNVLNDTMLELNNETKEHIEDLIGANFPVMNDTTYNDLNSELLKIKKFNPEQKEKWLKEKYENDDYTFYILPNGNIQYNYINLTTNDEGLANPIVMWFVNGDDYKKLKTNKERNINLGDTIEEIMFDNKYKNISNVLGDFSDSYTLNNKAIVKTNYLTTEFQKYSAFEKDFDILNPTHFYNMKYTPLDVLKANSAFECKSRNHDFFKFYEGNDIDTRSGIELQETKFSGFQTSIEKAGETYYINYKILLNENTNKIEFFASVPKKWEIIDLEMAKNKEELLKKEKIPDKYFDWFKVTRNSIENYSSIFFYDDGVYLYDMINGSNKIKSSFVYKGKNNYYELEPKNSEHKKSIYNINKIDKTTGKLNESISRINDKDVNEYLKNTLQYYKTVPEKCKMYFGKKNINL